MTIRDEKIIELARKGLSARKIKERLCLEITSEQVGRIVRKHLGHATFGNNSIANAINSLRPYVVECLARLGKDPLVCEICLEPQPTPCDIYHTKYEGATIYDLQYVCRSCNLARANIGLR